MKEPLIARVCLIEGVSSLSIAYALRPYALFASRDSAGQFSIAANPNLDVVLQNRVGEPKTLSWRIYAQQELAESFEIANPPKIAG